ncbi:MAG: type II toxin-antitoxin system PemK/MazF family toxin [Lactobacillales bacterium]|jgi:mRNA interferase MazF|nr:type II toxin-antitoxin system PemK/MazF family toxin [Lactobacillales bacterium]
MIRRGDVFYANLSPVIGSEQGGIRPVLVVQNNRGNYFSPTLIVAPITRKLSKKALPTQVPVTIPSDEGGTPSVVLLEQLRTLDKGRILHKVCCLEEEDMTQVNQALKISVGIKG